MDTIPTTNWLYPEEQREVVQRLLELGLLKFDNTRSLPLKSGGFTDVYINLRNARRSPEALRFVSDLFVPPMRRLGIDQFVEIPHSVSCFAPLISVSTGIPYLTVRAEGRATQASLIGEPVRGHTVAFFDDVVTDGASKEEPIRQCERSGLIPRSIVVLVDRQQGWQSRFAEQGIEVPVWAGMTLHDVRRELICGLGAMQRCDPKLEADNPIIVALDGKNWDEILPLVDRLRTTGCVLKVNDLLFDQGIAHILPELSVYGRVMVDLKGHDIPNTVANVCDRIRPHNPWAVTVHGSGGGGMIEAAVKALEGTDTKILAVTVLTSIDPDTCEEIYGVQPITQVLKIAKIAARAGAQGLVCSPQEVAALRERFPKLTLVTPGIRSAGADAGDQKRIATPKAAMDSGSNHLVMGRQILGAEDPVAEVRRVMSEELGVSL